MWTTQPMPHKELGSKLAMFTNSLVRRNFASHMFSQTEWQTSENVSFLMELDRLHLFSASPLNGVGGSPGSLQLRWQYWTREYFDKHIVFAFVYTRICICVCVFVLSYCECFVTRCHYKQNIFVLSFSQAWYFEKTFIHGARLITKVSKIF